MIKAISKFINGITTFKFLFTFINRFECVKKYEKDRDYCVPNSWDVRSHINWGVISSILGILALLIHPIIGVHLYVLLFLLYSPLTELWFQYDDGKGHVNKDKELWWLCAQIFERGIGAVALFPFLVAAYVSVKITGFYLLKIWGL